MTRRRALLVALTLALLVALGVGMWALLRPGRRGEAIAPRRWASAGVPEAPISDVVVPITIPMEVLETSLEASIPQVFVEEKGRALEGGFVLTAKIARSGPLSLGSRGGALELTLPVSAQIEVTPPRSKRALEVDGALALTAKVALSLGADWGLRSRTTLRYTWTKAPVLQVGPLKVEVERYLRARLDEQLVTVAARVDERLRQRDPVRARLEATWAALHEPMPARGRIPAWISIQPVALMSGDPRIARDGVHLDAGLRGRLRLVLGEAPAAFALTPLPPRVAPDGDGGISLQIPVALDWETLSAMMTEKVAARAQTLDVPGTDEAAQLTVSRVLLYPSGEAVVAALDYQLDGPSTPLDGGGRLYLSGVPTLDTGAQELRLTRLEAAIETDVDAVGAVGWLMEAGGIAALEERMRLPLGERLEDARAELETALGEANGKKAMLQADIQSLSLREVVPTEDALVVTLIAEGTAEIALHQLDGRRRAAP